MSLAGDEVAVAGEAHLAVDVSAVGVFPSVGDEPLGAAVVAVDHQVVALGAEHQVGRRVEGLGLQGRVEADAGHQAVEAVGGAGDGRSVVEGQQADAVVGGTGAGHSAGDAAAVVFDDAQVAAGGAVVAFGHQHAEGRGADGGGVAPLSQPGGRVAQAAGGDGELEGVGLDRQGELGVGAGWRGLEVEAHVAGGVDAAARCSHQADQSGFGLGGFFGGGLGGGLHVGGHGVAEHAGGLRGTGGSRLAETGHGPTCRRPQWPRRRR